MLDLGFWIQGFGSKGLGSRAKDFQGQGLSFARVSRGLRRSSHRLVP